MLWFFIAVSAYLLFALAAVGDKALLSGTFKNTATYAVFVGAGGLLPFVVLVCFIGIPLPGSAPVLMAFFSGVLFILALLPYYRGIQLFEVSRIVPGTGGLVPLFTFVLGLLFLPGDGGLSPAGLGAFFLLIGGSVLLSVDHTKKISWQSLKFSLFASALFASSFLLLKYAYLLQSLWSGLLWVQIGSAAAALVIFFSLKSVRADIWERLHPAGKRDPRERSTIKLFLATQASAASASILQHAAFFLAPAAYFAFVNALQGVQYFFLLVLAGILSKRYPDIFREVNSGRTMTQKVSGIVLVVAGLAVLIAIHPPR